MKTIELTKTDICRGYLILVSRKHPMKAEPGKGNPRLVPADKRYPEILLKIRPAILLRRLIENCGGQQKIVPVSGYRTLSEQRHIFEESLRENGADFTHRFVALPNCSEHQTGLAIDLAENRRDIDFLRPDFPETGIFKTFRERAALFGFVERYPKGKETVTGIAFEPWHFRYVGYPHAKIMRDHGFALEEYIEFVRGFPYPQALSFEDGKMKFEISFAQTEDMGGISDSMQDGRFRISGDNADGVIVTSWRSMP